MIVLALALAQAAWTAAPATATVGDTVWLERTLPAGGAHARLEPLAADDVLEPLRDPVVQTRDGRTAVRYAVALFRPGRVSVPMPAVELQLPDGRVETLAADTAWVTVRSVLPAGDALPEPMPSLAPMPRRRVSPLPLALALGAVIVGTAAWGVRRRWRRPRPVWLTENGAEPEPPLERWAASGEPRAVAVAVADALRGRIAARCPAAVRRLSVEECLAAIVRDRPHWPVRELAEVLRALERARFAPAVAGEVVGLAARARTAAAALDARPAGGGS
jgi:hypothetical protein